MAVLAGRSRARLLALAVALAAVLLLLVLVGRWEGRRHERAEVAGMRRVLALVGPIDNPTLNAYRIDIDFEFDCLLYRRGANRFALELCFDRSGRLAEAIDRRRGTSRIWSLREHPQASTIRVDRSEVVRLLKRLGAPPPRGGWR
jgi:hypothetical protein